MWQEFKDTWQYVNPQSTNYEYMQEPLASEEVWVAWDHVARLTNALKTRPIWLAVRPSSPRIGPAACVMQIRSRYVKPARIEKAPST